VFGMHPQLQAIADDFHLATARLHALVRAVPAEKWGVRHGPESWSVSECVAHLNLTGAAYAGIFPDAIARARALGPAPAGVTYTRDLWSWLLAKAVGPKVLFKMKTPAKFIPQAVVPVMELVREFERWQGVQLDTVAALDGLRLNEVRVQSPFNRKVSYNIYGCLSILPPHQHRHLQQAERVW
jgi:DinB family protein